MKTFFTILVALMLSTGLHANSFFQEEDKQMHIGFSIPFGMLGTSICVKEFGLQGWQAIACGTSIGLIPGLVKEAIDQHNYNGWDNRDLLADGIGSFVGSIGSITIHNFSSGKW